MRKCLLVAVLLSAIFPALAVDYSTRNDILYRTGEVDKYSSSMCRVNVAWKEGLKDRPVIVWFHGGGLVEGWREVPKDLLAKDYVVIGAGYRFSPKATFPEILDDCAAAVAWAVEHAEEYGGSKDKIYLAGHSAGGYIVTMLGLDKHYLAKYGVDSDMFAAICPYSGQMISHFNERKLRGVGPLTPEINDLSPMAHMRNDCPPLFIVTGDREIELFGRYEENAYFVRMMKLLGHKDITFYELQGFDHGGMCAPTHKLLLKYISGREKTR